ncbi:hypothetical protein LK06_020300 [Streptomyces pluripotens]|nr:hypothetical protein LK06_020300 [Streptomyces pluripotens]
MCERRPALRKLVLAAVGLALLGLVTSAVSDVVGAEFPQRPVWDLGSAGPWVASYARAVAAGSWMAARACVVFAGLLLLLEFVSRVLGVVRGGARRRGRPVG